MSWSTADNIVFYHKKNISYDSLPPGVYDVEEVVGMIKFTRVNSSTKDLITFEDSPMKLVLEDLKSFWNSKDKFEKFSIPYKRGILLYGPPGCAKSSTIAQVSEKISKKGGYVLIFSSLYAITTGIEILRSCDKATPIVVVMEDLDQIMYDESPSEVLNLLDGAYADIQNVVYLATTNRPQDLENNILNRPSRFDRRIEFGPPSDLARKAYIKSLIASGNKKPKIKVDTKIDIEKWVEKTADLSFAHIKELFISVICFSRPFDEVIAELQNISFENINEEENYE